MTTAKSLIIGMGIGQLYKQVLTELDHTVITADINGNADYKFWDDVLRDHKQFDTIHICTPNFTHESIARTLAKHTKILFIEKPGLSSESNWKKLITDFPKTRILMVKNNMWRDNIDELRDLYKNSKTISFKWLNENRVPNPGSWFTNKELAFGGVSRDLLPHLLSLFAAVEPKYDSAVWLYKHAWQKYTLKDLTDSDYGTVDPNGIYNVDDHVELECTTTNNRCYFQSSWRTLKPNDVGILFDNTFIELGLCPEDAYKNMIKDCLQNLDNDLFWNNQYELDCWIHGKINL
jgi:predicted dehydrogenase